MSKSKQLPSSLYRQLKEANAKLQQQVAELQAAQGCTAEVQALRNAIRKRDEHIAAAEAQIKAHLQELGDYDGWYDGAVERIRALDQRVRELEANNLRVRMCGFGVLAVFAVYVLVDVLQCFLLTSG